MPFDVYISGKISFPTVFGFFPPLISKKITSPLFSTFVPKYFQILALPYTSTFIKVPSVNTAVIISAPTPTPFLL